MENLNLIQREELFARKLRPLRPICAALAGSVLLVAAAAWFLLRPGGFAPPPLPDAVPLSITAAAAILILLSSRLRANIVRRSFPSDPALRPQPEAVVAAYKRAPSWVSWWLCSPAPCSTAWCSVPPPCSAC
jgi:hypothetical protein